MKHYQHFCRGMWDLFDVKERAVKGVLAAKGIIFIQDFKTGNDFACMNMMTFHKDYTEPFWDVEGMAQWRPKKATGRVNATTKNAKPAGSSILSKS